MSEQQRISPEEALEKLNHEALGKLKIFIGYAPGVGKTYTMLNEGNRRKKYGQDVIIGYIECHGREETDAQIAGLEVLPRMMVSYNGCEMEEMNAAAIIARKPQLVLVDELAHTNVPGSKNAKRYMDVEEILKAGINVITTLNIQHIESLNDIVQQITGIKVKETIPDYIVQRADEVVVVDLTPDALQNHLKRGNVYNMSKVPQALHNFFRKGNLNALRELTLREIAQEVDEDLKEYMKMEGIQENWTTSERIMVCISPSKTARKLIRRGARLANRYKCEWYVVTVNCTSRLVKQISNQEQALLKGHFQLAEQLGGHVVQLTGKSVSQELAKWANEKHITQIFIGYPKRTKIETIIRGSTVNKLIRMLNNIDLHLISNEF